MAKVVWAPGISTVSGALSKINKKSPHAADQQMLLAKHRVAPSESTDCNRLYLMGINAVSRSTEPSADELAVRTRFAIVSAQVAQRKKSLATMNADREAFYAQKDTPGGKKTLTAYLWMVVGAAYDAEHQG